ncbi:hypothetical protein CgunFtcFv8_006822 [Champsocephalus gunnari]|uniref:Uncharacterized protein n=1 Tax=Champsocephalus gunnari TaxID=52237 RepID=A0AAN8H5A8_CHAGU|nr:hypothetical protein CgunFtcFv8_006822 [Champsocephalus gunnari]
MERSQTDWRRRTRGDRCIDVYIQLEQPSAGRRVRRERRRRSPERGTDVVPFSMKPSQRRQAGERAKTASDDPSRLTGSVRGREVTLWGGG